MDNTMYTDTLIVSDHGLVASVEFEDQEDAIRLRALLESRGDNATPVQLVAAPGADVEGHAALRSVELTLRLDENDVEGHAISVQFPTAADANRFRRNLIVGGVLAGSIVLGTAGAIAITSQAASPADSTHTQQTPAYERPADRGLLEGVDMTTPVNAAAPVIGATPITPAFDSATGRPAGHGFLEDADGPAQSSETTDGSVGHGPLEGVDR